MPREVCPSNPYFYTWLKELRDSAKDKNTQAYYTYSKALKSLIQYPLPLRSGEEAKIIKNVGDKMAKILDKKCLSFYKERGFGLIQIEHFMTSCPFEKLPTVKDKVRLQKEVKKTKKQSSRPLPADEPSSKRKKRKVASPPPSPPPHRTSPPPSPPPHSTYPPPNPASPPITKNGHSSKSTPGDIISEIEDILARVNRPTPPRVARQPPPPVPRAARQPPAPVPRAARQPPPAPRAVARQQPPTTSYLHSPDSPPQISSAVRPTTSHLPITRPLPLPVPKPARPTTSTLFDDLSQVALALEAEDEDLLYTYVDTDGKDTCWRYGAALLEDLDITGLWMLIKVPTRSLPRCGKMYLECTTKTCPDPDCSYVYLESSECGLSAPGLPPPRTRALPPPDVQLAQPGPSGRITSQPTCQTHHSGLNGSRPPLPDISDSEDDDDDLVIDQHKLTQVIRTGLKPSQSAHAKPLPRTIKPLSSSTKPVPSISQLSPPTSRPLPSRPTSTQPSTSREPSNTSSTTSKHSSEPSKMTLPTIVCTLPKSTFRVVLCVDNGEVNFTQQLLKELTQHGVEYDVRQLQVGDFLWIARDTSSSTELVLDVVVERKRMDDLAASITGGRFVEQKLRLKSCGLSRRVYLVETKSSYISLPEASLNQAVVNTQVIDGFSIKKTKDLKETAAYLTIMTKFLARRYQDLDVNGVEDPSRTSTTNLLTFSAFSQNSVKNRVYTTQETFLRQLSRIPRISQDKAEAITQVYPTPRALLNALYTSPTPSTIVEHIKFGVSQRKIGIAASRAVATFYTTTLT